MRLRLAKAQPVFLVLHFHLRNFSGHRTKSWELWNENCTVPEGLLRPHMDEAQSHPCVMTS